MYRLFIPPQSSRAVLPKPQFVTMKKQKRLSESGTQQSSQAKPEEAIPVAIFKNSLRLWQARFQARKAMDQSVASDPRTEPEADQ